MFKIKHIVFMLFLASQLLSAQAEPENRAQVPKNSISNFILGIQSNIHGIKKCCIYFAGKYKVEDAVQTLIDEFDKAGESEYKPLIAWSLFRIGNETCIKKLQDISRSYSHEELKMFCSTLLNIKEYAAELEKPHL